MRIYIYGINENERRDAKECTNKRSKRWNCAQLFAHSSYHQTVERIHSSRMHKRNLLSLMVPFLSHIEFMWFVERKFVHYANSKSNKKNNEIIYMAVGLDFATNKSEHTHTHTAHNLLGNFHLFYHVRYHQHWTSIRFFGIKKLINGLHEIIFHHICFCFRCRCCFFHSPSAVVLLIARLLR